MKMNRVLVLAVGMVLLVGNLVGCKADPELSFAELQQKLSTITEDGRGAIVNVKERLGEPYREQEFGDKHFLYYRVREGTAQVVVLGTGGPLRHGDSRWIRVFAVNLL